MIRADAVHFIFKPINCNSVSFNKIWSPSQPSNKNEINYFPSRENTLNVSQYITKIEFSE